MSFPELFIFCNGADNVMVSYWESNLGEVDFTHTAAGMKEYKDRMTACQEDLFIKNVTR